MRTVSSHEAILNSMSEAVYVIDRDMRIHYANPAAEQLTGYSAAEAVGKYCHDIFCERSELCADRCPPRRAMIQETPILHREAETRHKDGTVRQTQVSVSPFFEDGACVGAVVVTKDITELKGAEAKIRRQNLFLRAVIDALPHPFYVVDASTYELMLVNEAAYRGDLPAHTTCHQLSHGRSLPCAGDEHPCPLAKVTGTGQPATVEHRHRQADGTFKDVEVHGYPIFDNDGRIIQFIEYCVDISDRKRAAEEREKLIRELQDAMREVKMLSGLLPICSSCKKIKDDHGSWSSLETYISAHSEAEFSHGICPECAQRLYPDYYKKKK